MKKVLGIVASQRKLANGEILIKEAASSIEEDYKLELIKLPELNLQPCKACYTCLIPDKQCSLPDDLYYLLERIKEADGIIMSSPCYVLGPAAVTKLLGDRTIAFAQHLDALWGKPCVLITTAGIKGWEGYTLSALIANARFWGLDVKDAHMFIGALPGEALTDPHSMERIHALGAALFGKHRKPEAGQCPTCWSELWKFPAPNHAVCPFCGQEAELSPSEKGIQWKFGPEGQRFTKEALTKHFRVWLVEQVREFVSRRKELALIRNRYKTQDLWLKP